MYVLVDICEFTQTTNRSWVFWGNLKALPIAITPYAALGANIGELLIHT